MKASMLQKGGSQSVEKHDDLFSLGGTSNISPKRAQKLGREEQKPMQDNPNGADGCLLCNPHLKKQGTSPVEVVFPDRVANFLNDFPFLAKDQRVIFLWHSDPEKRKKHLHHYRLEDVGEIDLYWLLKAGIKLGNNAAMSLKNSDLMSMVVGFNLGHLAGQSIPHVHIQYGWDCEINVKKHSISPQQLAQYFDELEQANLLISQSERVKLVAPWTPKGQYALDLYFNDKFDICEMDNLDVKLFASFGFWIIRRYLELGIQNLNIVFTNSAKGRKTQPLTVHFVPRVNIPALFEIRGVNVVDTPPSMIANKFRIVDWTKTLKDANAFEPDQAFERLTRN